jgi:hypothetical protein
MPRTALLAAVSLLTLCGCRAPQPAAPQESRILMGPYVTELTASTARVMWVARPEMSTTLVRARGAGQDSIVPAGSSAVEGREERVHSAAFSGLRPGSAYEYELGGPNGASGRFRTAPEPGQPFRFVAYGDTRSNPGDHAAVSRGIAREDPAFVLMSGDLVADGDNWDLWNEQFFGPAAPYLKGAAIQPARGNHEGSAAFYADFLGRPLDRLYYSFDYGNAHFVVLDNYAADREAMVAWLDEDLAASDAEWKFVCYHTPTFNVGGHASTWGREDVLPVMEKHGVDFAFYGHSHLYERFLPIGPAGGKPIIHVVTGAGGAPLYAAEPSPILAGGIGRSELHFCVMDVDGNRCTMTVKRPDGTVIDSLALVKTDGRYQEEVMAQAIDTRTAEASAFALTDLAVDFDPLPGPLGHTTATLRIPALPDGSVISIGPAGSATGWQVAPQEVTVADGAARFDVVAPEALEMTPGGCEPPLRVSLAFGEGIGGGGVRDMALSVGADTLRRAIPAPEPVGLPQAAGPIAVDGAGEDWQGVQAVPLPFMEGRPGSLKLCWAPDGIYGLLSAADASVVANSSEPWRADTLELFIDTDWSRAARRTPTSAQYMLSPAPDAGPGRAHVTVAYGANSGKADEIECEWRPATGGYVMEFLIPAAFLQPAQMAPGSVLGLNFALSDDGSAVEQFYSDKDTYDGWQSPLTWGAVVLEE